MMSQETPSIAADTNKRREHQQYPSTAATDKHDDSMEVRHDEESPLFREAQHDRQRRLESAMVMKASDALSRGESGSSTGSTGSTAATSDELTSQSSTSNIYGKQNVICRVKEDARDGDWLQQLQYRLYSREEEEAMLLRTYRASRRPSTIHRSHHNHRRSNSNTNATYGALCLISGAAGLGKSRLARTLEIPVKEDGGYFISAKFDQAQGVKPTRIFADAFEEFTHAVLAQGPETVATVQREIRNSLGDELPVLLAGLPMLEKIMGPASGQPLQFSCQMATRFIFALQGLIDAVCTQESPMVIMFDDMMWADQCSLRLLKSFLSSNQNPHLFLLATCDDSVGPCSHVSKMLRDLEDEGNLEILNIEVKQKPCEETSNIITAVMPMEKDRHDVLARFVCDQTGGNPLYIMEFLTWLSDEGLLQYNAAKGEWNLHENDVRLSIDTCKFGDFLVGQLEKLPPDVCEIIKVAACFGSSVNEDLMNAVFTADLVTERLHDATSMGFLVFDDDLGYSFRHDGLQKAALSLIPTEEKEVLHLELGRKLFQNLTEEKRNRYQHLILGQLRLGKALIKDPTERVGVAMLCLQAGQSSAKTSAFGAAAGYMEFGIDLLDASWEGDYSLKLTLYNAAAEMRLTTSEFEQVHALLQPVFDNVPVLKHKLQAYNTLIYLYGVQDQRHLALDTGIKILSELGETFPTENCRASLCSEVRKVYSLLRGKSNAQIMRMEAIKQEDKLAALQLLNIMFVNALLVRPGFAPFIQLKSVEITMRYGLSALASNAFASYGMLCSSLEKFDDAQRYGELALDLLKKFRSKEYVSRVFAAVYGSIIPWQRPIRETIEPLKEGQRIGSQTGDIEFASMNASIYAGAMFFTDAKLPFVSKQISSIGCMMKSRRQESMLMLLEPFKQLIHNLMGLADDPKILSVDCPTTCARNECKTTIIVCIRLQKMMLFYLFGDYEKALETAVEVESMQFMAPGIEYIFNVFFIGMTHLAAARSLKRRKKQKCIAKAKRIIKKFKNWSLNSPHNCLALKYLLEAEMASIQGKAKKAYEKYTASTALATDAGFSMIEAVAHESCGRHLYAIGNESMATSSLRKAVKCYQDWGAMAKATHLEEESEGLFKITSIRSS